MKYILSPLLFILLSCAVHAQKDTTILYIDSNLNIVSKPNAACIEKVYQQGGMWHTIISYINKPAKLVTGSYSDKRLSIPEGQFTYYKEDTVIMQGNYRNGEQDGVWRKWMTNGLITDSVVFMSGTVIAEAKYQYHTNNTIWRYSLKTAENEKITGIYDTAGVIISKGRFKDNDGEMYTYYPNGAVKTHSVYKNNQRTIYDLYDENGEKKQ